MKGQAYGLIWQAETALPFLPAPAAAVADINVIFDAQQSMREQAQPYVRRFTLTGSGFELHFEAEDAHWATYSWCDADRSLTVTSSRSADQCWPALVGLIPAILLRARGRTLLHGAVVEIGQRGFAIVGPSGAGKSTLAAALVQRGARIVTDDLILIKAGSVVRGYTRIGLLADAAAALTICDDARAGLRLGDDKLQIKASSEVAATVPLAAVIALDPFDPAQAEPVLTQQSIPAAAHLVRRNLYGDWIGPMTAADGAFCLALVGDLPVHRLSRSANFTQIGAACAAIEAL
jgi:hypothetical protein